MEAWESVIAVLLVCRLGVTLGTTYPTVTTKDGTIRGIYAQSRDGQVFPAFLGVRYAKPPIGSLRFQNAEPFGPWAGEMVADAMPPACMQLETFLPVGPVSEDCLYLNIFTPNLSANPLLPVMVWIFGGGFQHGTISSYTPEYLMEGRVVLVTIQYRLGLFGFLSTGDSVLSGNQGIKDQRLALQWIQDNIHHFGGDRSKVTIFGQSSGGVSVQALLLYCSNAGLFRAGISQSGSLLVGFSFLQQAQVKDMVKSLATLANCPTQSTEFVQCMTGKSASDIVALFQKYQMSSSAGKFTKGLFPMPGLVLEPECVSDRIVTANPWSLKVSLPWIVGNNEKEGLSILAPLIADRTDMNFKLLSRMYNKFIPEALNCKYSSVDGSTIGPATKKFYLKDKPIKRNEVPELCECITDAFFTYGAYESMKRSDPSQTYAYIMKYRGVNSLFTTPIKESEITGACHGSETFLLFPHPFNITDSRIYSAEDEKKSKEIVKLWTNFAKYMNPTPDGSEMGYTWKSFGSEENYLEIGQSVTSMKSPYLPKRMKFWKGTSYPLRDDTIKPVPCNSKKK